MRIYYTHHERYFRCSTHYFASDRCSGTFVSEKVLYREVLKQIQLLYQQYIDEAYVSGNLKIENGYEDKKKTLESKIKSAQQEIEKLNKRFKNLYLDKLDEVISKEEFLLLSEDCQSSKQALEKNIADFQKEIDNISEQLSNPNSQINVIRQFKNIQELDSLTVSTLIDYIEVGGSKNRRIINIHWNL